jgi:hypothetical protein
MTDGRTVADDTQSWRERVAGDLAHIKAQLGRLASDRESEKETVIRVTQELKAEDRRNAEHLERHIEWNDVENGKLHEKLNALAWKFWFAAGVFAALQFLAPLIWVLIIK